MKKESEEKFKSYIKAKNTTKFESKKKKEVEEKRK